MASLRSLLVSAITLSIACGGDDSSEMTSAGTPATTTGDDTVTSGSSNGSSGRSSTTQSETSSSTDGSSSGSVDSSSSSGAPSTTSGSDSSGTTSAAAVTWENFGAAFFEAYCWECHGAGDAEGRDYTTLAGVMAEANPIRCGTGPASAPPSGCDGKAPPEQFPIGNNLPTEAERIMLVEWIDAGAPEN